MFKRILVVMFVCLICHNVMAANIEKNALVYITPMEGGLNNFLAAEIFKQGVPFQITLNQEKARYVILGSMTKDDGSQSNSLLEKITNWTNLLELDDRNQASVMLADPQEQGVLWAVSVGDNRVIMKLFVSGAQKKLAKDIVEKMKKDLFGTESKLKKIYKIVVGKEKEQIKDQVPDKKSL